MLEFWKDARFGLRLLARNPVFAVTASLLLGIGIGANTLIFSIVDTLLLRPLPAPHPEQLVRLVEVHSTNFVTWDLPYTLYEHAGSISSSLSEVFCQADLDVAFEDGSGTERIRINAVSGNFFSTLGIQAYLGRVLTPGDESERALRAVVSYDFWRKRLAGSPTAIGRSIRMNGRAFTVTGVLPRGVNGLTVDTSPDIRVPLAAGRILAQKPGVDPASMFLVQLQIFGRLRPGVVLEQAEAEVEARLRGPYDETLFRELPALGRPTRRESVLRLEPCGRGVSTLRAQFSRGLILLMAGVGLLLLMACANVACLLLARSAARSHEIAMRLILGASRWRIARQLLTESLVLALAGGAVGVLLTYACRPLLLGALPPIRDRAAVVQPLAVHVEVDMRVLAFAISVSILTALLFGLSPALRGARRGSRTATARLSGRNTLIAAQVAICVLLLCGAALLIETFDRMRQMDAGFDRDHIVTFTIDPGLKGYDADRAKLFSRQLLDKASVLPGVVHAALAGRALMRGTGIKATYGVAGSPLGANDFLNCSLNSTTPGYFETMGMRIVDGRDFQWSDARGLKVGTAVVNEAFVRRFFPKGNPIGRLIGSKGPDGLARSQTQIIGVVTGAKYRSLREEIPPTVYTPALDGFDSGFILHLRTQGQPAALVAPVRQALQSLDPELPFIEIRTMREEVETSLWQERLLAGLSALFGGFGALLAGIGLYGALDFAVKARTREIGVRVALGANPMGVIRLLSRETLVLIAAGAAGGFAIFGVSARWIRQTLYGVTALDPMAAAVALLFVVGVGFVSSAPPIWRAIRIEPSAALRQD